MASSTVTQYVRTSRNAIFNKVETNLISGYNALDGKFTAPARGLYLLYFTARDYRNYPTGTFMVQLNKDDQVYMKFHTNVNVYGGSYTWFGGHLINEM